MNKEELVKEAAKRGHFTQEAMRIAINAIVETIVDYVVTGGEVKIKDFGLFYLDKRNARTGRNPHTGEAVPIPARVLPAFKPGKEFRKAAKEMSERKKIL